ncbi:putative transglycosylase/D-alanyl-D-alanine carboxypeptidase [Vibrio phage phiKT1028]|nr:putative transglycosylase/D-alanyl-D-alanine carboxypeptidase [Vibrio phage phiKT1028]
MSFTLISAVKRIQLGAMISSLYKSRIDGIWGEGSRKGVLNLFNVVSNSEELVDIPAWSKAEDIIKGFQTNCRATGLYAGQIDGIWGKGSQAALESLVLANRRFNGQPDLDLAWSSWVPPEFTAVVKAWVAERGHEPCVGDYVMSIMAFESGRTFDPAIQNAAGSQAYGLIQFMGGAASDLGYTLDEIRSMEQIEQLEKCVLPYFDMRARRKPMKNLEDYYLSVLYPAYVGKGLDEVLFEKGSVGYRQNSGLDKNKDGNIVVGEIAETIYQMYYEGMKPKNRSIV